MFYIFAIFLVMPISVVLCEEPAILIQEQLQSEVPIENANEMSVIGAIDDKSVEGADDDSDLSGAEQRWSVGGHLGYGGWGGGWRRHGNWGWGGRSYGGGWGWGGRNYGGWGYGGGWGGYRRYWG